MGWMSLYQRTCVVFLASDDVSQYIYRVRMIKIEYILPISGPHPGSQSLN